MADRVEQLRIAASALVQTCADAEVLARICTMALGTPAAETAQQVPPKPKRKPPTVDREAPIPQALMTSVRLGIEIAGSKRAFARQSQLQDNRLAKALKTGLATKLIQARLERGLQRMDEHPTAAATAPGEVAQKARLLGLDAQGLADAAQVPLAEAIAALEGAPATGALLDWLDRDLLPDGRGGFVTA